MLDISYIKANREFMFEVVKNKKVEVNIDYLLDVYEQRQNLLQQIESLRTQKNAVAARMKDIALLSPEEKQALIQEGKSIKDSLLAIEDKYSDIDKEYQEQMLRVPNIYSNDTPIGLTEDENVVLRQVGDKPKFSFNPLEHWQLGKNLGLIDTEKSSEVSGARFAYLKGDLVLLQFALIQWVMSNLQDQSKIDKVLKTKALSVSNKAYTPVVPPVLMKPEVMKRMGRLDPIDDRYQTTEDGLMLVGSAEHTLGPLHMDEILDYRSLPLRYVGYSTAFRREAGTYGKDMKGILRLHQFDKIEIEVFSDKDSGFAEQDLILAIQEYLMQQLELPYQVVFKCTADMGTPDIRAYDIETWLPGQNQYRETHTSDYMGDFQSRRLQTRYKDADGNKHFVHMNDATVFAIGRILIAIMENYQQADGSILIPEVLQPYLGKKVITNKNL
ncbi:MAG: seryl-tRNA synthetase [Candidatus Parcubacteria bacterium]|jgi:seryl-tRNA synthetase